MSDNKNNGSAFHPKNRGFSFGLENFIQEPTVQIGNIVLPPDEIDKEQYGKLCREFGMYSVLLQSGTLKKRCITLCKEPFRIPEESSFLGETVLLLFPYNSDIPFIVKKIDDMGNTRNDSIDENSYTEVLDNEDVAIGITKNVKDGIYDISVMSEIEDKEICINLNVSAPNRKGKIRINVNGDCDIFAEKDVNILANKQLNLKIRDLTKYPKFHELTYNIESGFYLKDRWDNELFVVEGGLKFNTKKEVIINALENVKINASKEIKVIAGQNIKIDATGSNNIEIGNAESLAINQSTLCCFTGQPHFTPLTNNKTKV